MKARILQTLSATGPLARSLQCAAAHTPLPPRPRTAGFPPVLLPLHHRRFQSNSSNNNNNNFNDDGNNNNSSSNYSNNNNRPVLTPRISGLLENLLTNPQTPNNPQFNSYSLSPSLSSRNRHSPNGPPDLSTLGFGNTGPNNQFDISLAPPIGEDSLRVPRMGPTAGRSVLVQGDVTVAFTRLKSLVQANRVRSDLMKQRFHERPGLKRKRLKRERHRKRFKEGFKRMVGVILDMKNRGM